MTSAAPASAPDLPLAQQLDALLQHHYTTPATDPNPPPTSTSPSTDNTDQQPSTSLSDDKQPSTTPTTTPYNSRTAPSTALPATTHLLPVLAAIAATGRLSGYHWPAVRELLILRTRTVLDQYVQHTGVPPTSPSDPSDSFEPRTTHLLLLLSLFTSPPFTLQRLAELLVEPYSHYSSTSHYLAALCKCVYGITADEEDQEGSEEDSDMEVAELEAAGVSVTTAMDYVSKELPVATLMPSVLSVEPADDRGSNMETSD